MAVFFGVADIDRCKQGQNILEAQPSLKIEHINGYLLFTRSADQIYALNMIASLG